MDWSLFTFLIIYIKIEVINTFNLK